MSAACTDCSISERTPFNPELYSYKLNKAGLRYEVAICISIGTVAWVHGPFAFEMENDLKEFKKRLAEAVEPNELVMADRIYRQPLVITPESEHDKWSLSINESERGRRHLLDV